MKFEYEKIAPVRWPTRRHALVWYLYELASPSFQQKYWIEGERAETGEMHDFSLIINFFFDDTELGDHSERTIGDILTDELEVSALQRVGRALSRVCASVGPGSADVDYVTSAHWAEVVGAAVKAYRLLRPRLQLEGDNLLPPPRSSA
jgi:hypothetical protein